MLIIKNKNGSDKVVSVVTCTGGINDPEAVSTEGIYLNKNYTLIYRCDRKPKRIVKKTVPGSFLIIGLMRFQHLVNDVKEQYPDLSEKEFLELSNKVCLGIVETWGRLSLGIKVSNEFVSKEDKRVIKKSIKKKGGRGDLVFEELMYAFMAHRLLKHQARTLTINDVRADHKDILEMEDHYKNVDGINKTDIEGMSKSMNENGIFKYEFS